MGKQDKSCSEMGKVESLLLQYFTSDNEPWDSVFETHLHTCDVCMKRYQEMKQLYRYVFHELEKPVCNATFRLVKAIEADRIIIAGILLKPQLLDEEPGKRHFTSEIILTTYQSEELDSGNLNDVSLLRDEVLIRAVQSISTQETTLFLYSDDKRLYSNVTFALPTLEMSFKSDLKGKVDIGQVDISSFDQLEVMIATNLQL